MGGIIQKITMIRYTLNCMNGYLGDSLPMFWKDLARFGEAKQELLVLCIMFLLVIGHG